MRTLILSLTLFIGLLCQNAFADNPAAKQLSLAQVKSDVALAKEAYSRIHPGYTRYATEVEMNAAWTSIIQEAETTNGMSLGDFYLAIERTLTAIRCDHTKAELPKVLADQRRTDPLYLPFRWKLIEGRGIIYNAAEGTGLTFGDEIISIDGRSLKETVDRVAPLIPVDGYTEWSRRGGISESLEFKGGAVDHFGALIWDTGPVANLKIRSITGDMRDVAVNRVNFEEWTALGDATGRARNFKDALTFERIGDRGAYIRVDTFVNYRQPVKPESVYGAAFKAIKEEGRDQLILDLRNNGGGSSDASHGLIANLIQKKMPLHKDMRVATINHDGLTEHLSTWDKRALNPNPLGFKKNDDGTYSLRRFVGSDLKTIKPTKNAFDGELIILTSTDNSSGSTNLLSLLAGLGRATLIGEKTGGSSEGPTAGILFTLTLPESGIKTRIPVFRFLNNVSSFEEGLGITPDIAAPLTVSAFLAGKDPAMEAALARITD